MKRVVLLAVLQSFCTPTTPTPADQPEEGVSSHTSDVISSASLQPGSTAAGAQAVISISVTARRDVNALIDVEVYTHAGARVIQHYWDNQPLVAGVPSQFVWSWPVPGSQPAGSYRVKVGVFTAGWDELLHWNDAAAELTVLPNGGGGGGGSSGATSGTTSGTTSGGGAASRWLHTSGNRIYTAGGVAWQGKGANLHDTRSCNACSYSAPNVAEVKRRVDELVSWGADFIRLDLESYASAEGRVHWKGVLEDPAYLAHVVEIVRHIGTKPNVYVMVSLWHDASINEMGWPTTATQAVWRKLAETFLTYPYVLFGLVNEPQSNFDGEHDEEVWTAMNDTVAAIRSVEDAAGAPYHIVAVQGTGGWARRLDYYVTHPIQAGGGRNVAYEIHVYDPMSEFDEMFVRPAQTLPVIIGEFGPASGYMTQTDSKELMRQADRLGIPYLSWTFHGRCAPNLLVDLSNGGCGVGMALKPTSWGTLFRNHLQGP